MRESMYSPQESLEVIYEDDVLLAVNKPAGLVVHPTYRNATGTLLDTLRDREPAARFFLVGRLDRLTTGVVIAAKTRDAYVAIQRTWAEAEKDYLAVVHGFVDPACGEIDLPLGTDPADRRRRMVRPDGAPSVTRFERLAYSTAAGVSLLRCRLVTGRRHQIRVHLLARGWPVVGDPVYGTLSSPFPRQALHAWRTTMRHPTAGEEWRIEASLPSDLAEFLRAVGVSLTHRLRM